MATVGHLITMLGVAFFFATIIDSFIERKVPAFYSYGVPRFYKRTSYYLFKVRHFRFTKKQNQIFPNPKARLSIVNYFGESEFK
jgi:hypothetical protein